MIVALNILLMSFLGFVVLASWKIASARAASRTELRMRQLLSKHEHIYDDVEVTNLLSEWEGMVGALKYNDSDAKKHAEKFTKQELADLTQPRCLVRARCACGNERVVLVFGKQAVPYTGGEVRDMTQALSGR